MEKLILDQGMDFYFEALEELLPGGVGIYQYPETHIPLYVGKGVRELFAESGKDYKEQSEKELFKMVCEGDYIELKECLKKSEKTNEKVDCEIRFHTNEGKTNWLWVRGMLLDLKGQKVFVALLVDITDRKEMENELFIQAERYRILEETTGEILFEYKPLKNVMTYSIKERSGALVRKEVPEYTDSLKTNPLVHIDYLPLFLEHLEKATTASATDEFEYLSKISGGGYEWHRLNYISVEDSGGRIKSVFGRIKNIHEEVLERQILHSKTDVDRMTNLMNKDYIRKKIEAKLNLQEKSCKHTMIQIGINHFRRIISQHGHACGDAVIQCVSSILLDRLSGLAIIGRYKDEKFIAYMENCEDETIDELVSEVFESLQMPENQVADIEVSCCIGVATYRGVITFDELYEKADEAIHLARITKDTNYVRI